MTMLSRTLCFVGVVIVAYFMFFWKPREVAIEVPAPQAAPQVKPQQPTRARPRPQLKPQPDTFEPPRPQPDAFEPDSDQPVFRALQSQPKTQQTQRERRPAVYEWEPAFNTALMETDQSKRQERIDAAQSAINQRLQELNGQDAPKERRAIENAQLGLSLLQSQTNSQSRSR